MKVIDNTTYTSTCMLSFERPAQIEKPHTRKPWPTELVQHEREREPRVERVICLSDIHNDLLAAQASLRQQDIIDEHGEWKHSVNLIITGDSINRNEPNTEVLKYFRHLKKTAPIGCTVTMLVGNHELDVLTQIASGADMGLKKKMQEFLGSMDVVCRQGPVLYLHRYPSMRLVRELWQQYQEQGGNPDVWRINRRFQEAVLTMHQTPERSKTVFRECDDGGDEMALEGLSTELYFQNYGVLIGQFLKEMRITTVIHGHKKQKEGGQRFEQYIPGICVVNNDSAISSDKNLEHQHRIGSLEVAPAPDEGVEVTCRYKPNIKPNGRVRTQTATIH